MNGDQLEELEKLRENKIHEWDRSVKCLQFCLLRFLLIREEYPLNNSSCKK